MSKLKPAAQTPDVLPPRRLEPAPALSSNPSPEPSASAFVQAALGALHMASDPEVKSRKFREAEETQKRRRGPKPKISEAKLREQIRLKGGSKAGKKVVADALGVDSPTLWRWCKAGGFLNWKEACWYYSKY